MKSPERPTSIFALWSHYAKRCIPDGAGTEQRTETRRAFYAGAAALFGLITAVSADEVSLDAGAAYLSKLDTELYEWTEQMRRGEV